MEKKSHKQHCGVLMWGWYLVALVYLIHDLSHHTNWLHKTSSANTAGLIDALSASDFSKLGTSSDGTNVGG
jgi:hypothetical protein